MPLYPGAVEKGVVHTGKPDRDYTKSLGIDRRVPNGWSMAVVQQEGQLTKYIVCNQEQRNQEKVEKAILERHARK